MREILKNSLLSLYSDSPEICDMLNLLDFSVVERKFRDEVYSRISKEEFDEVDNFLTSDKYLRYAQSIASASQAVTVQLTELIEFTLHSGQEKGRLN